MNKLYYPTDIFLPIANTLCNELAPISRNMGALSTFVTKIAVVLHLQKKFRFDGTSIVLI